MVINMLQLITKKLVITSMLLLESARSLTRSLIRVGIGGVRVGVGVTHEVQFILTPIIGVKINSLTRGGGRVINKVINKVIIGFFGGVETQKKMLTRFGHKKV